MPYFFVLMALLFSLMGKAQGKYVLKSGDANGINKWYMDRQIAQVMSHYGIVWLEREERDKEENTSLLLKNLQVQKGMMIADIGAGSGYHSSLLSKLIGNGKVYSVDVEPEMISFLKERIQAEKTKNIIPVLSTEKSVELPANSVDLMLLVDVYHEFSFPYEMCLSMLSALKPGGKLVLVEFRTEDAEVPIKSIHKMSAQQAVLEFTSAGFIFEKNMGNLPWQHCMFFRKKN